MSPEQEGGKAMATRSNHFVIALEEHYMDPELRNTPIR